MGIFFMLMLAPSSSLVIMVTCGKKIKNKKIDVSLSWCMSFVARKPLLLLPPQNLLDHDNG